MTATLEQNNTPETGGAGPTETGAVPAPTSEEASNLPPSGGTPEESPDEARKSKAERAMERAQARMAAKAAEKTTSNPQPGEQAAGDGESIPNQGEGDPAAQSGQATTGAEGGDKANSPGSIVEAPADWPAQLQEQFTKLPEDARPMVLGIAKDLQAGFTRAMQSLADERNHYGELRDQEQKFKADPKGFIQSLAQQANVEVFFERPLPEGEVPNFESPKDMALWAKEEAKRELLAEQAKRESASQAEADKTARDQEIASEFRTAAADLPDFGDHREGVLNVMAGSMARGRVTVGEAYRLATYDGLYKLAQEGQKAHKELTKLRAEVERNKKTSTTPPKSKTAGELNPEEKHLSPGMRAYQRAQRKIAAKRA